MRVRIRRFGRIELRTSEQPGNAKLVEVGVWERIAQSGAVGDVPWTVNAPGCLGSQVFAHSQGTQLGEPHLAAFPLLPDHGSQPSPYPWVQIPKHRGRLREAEVAFPAA